MAHSLSLSVSPLPSLSGARASVNTPALDASAQPPPLRQRSTHTPSLHMTSPRRQHCATRAGAEGGAHWGGLRKGSLGPNSRVAQWEAGVGAGARAGVAARAAAPEASAGAGAGAVAELAEAGAGPQELPPIDDYSAPAVLEAEETTPFQTAASVVLTGALTLLLIRTFRRRAKKSKESKMRSSVVDRLTPPSEVDKAKAALKAASLAEPASPPPTAFGALSGAVMAGAITWVAYKFTVGVDENFAQQTVSANYTIRNITITIRTIISGLGWLATGVFGANTLGLTLLAFQIALGLNPETEASEERREAQSLSAEAEASAGRSAAEVGKQGDSGVGESKK